MDKVRTGVTRRKRQQRIALAGVAALILAGAAWAIVRANPPALTIDSDAVLVDTVRRGEFTRDVRAPGVLVPREIRWLVAEAPGRVETIDVRPGAAVEADTVIVTLTNPDVARAVQDAEWALSQGEAELAALRLSLQSEVLDQKSRVAEVRANAGSARLQAQAEDEALRIDAVSRLQARRSQIVAGQLAERLDVELERLENLKAATGARLRAQAAKIEVLRNTLARQRHLADALNIRAGMAGVLQSLPVQIGESLEAGEQVARVAKPGELMAELRVPELGARDLSIGLSASIDTRSGLIAGTVARIDPAVENGTVKVEVRLDGALPAVARADLSVDGLIEIERLAQALFVARPAQGADDTTLSVFRLDADGHYARRVDARFGKASARTIAIEQGLEAGDRIIVSDVSQWSGHDVLRLR